MTAQQKAEWHRDQAVATRYRLLPGGLVDDCLGATAMAGLFDRKALYRVFEEPSGYADASESFALRYLGKEVHRRGSGAMAEIELSEPLMGLPAGTHPATIRFSHATTHHPFIAGVTLGLTGFGNLRPALAISIHQDYEKSDQTIFLMPPRGLEGFSFLSNPFSRRISSYTHHLDRPGWATRLAAAVTFERAAYDVYHQIITAGPLENYWHGEEGDTSSAVPPKWEDTLRLDFKPDPLWEKLYAEAQRPNYRQKLGSIEVDDQNRRFLTYTISEKGKVRPGGTVRLLSRWESAEHIDSWIFQHQGWVLWPK